MLKTALSGLVSYNVNNILDAHDAIAGAVELLAARDVDRNEDPCFGAVYDGVELDDVDLLFVDLVEHVDKKAVAVHSNDNELDIVARELRL